jgi:hypothetical protein
MKNKDGFSGFTPWPKTAQWLRCFGKLLSHPCAPLVFAKLKKAPLRWQGCPFFMAMTADQPSLSVAS